MDIKDVKPGMMVDYDEETGEVEVLLSIEMVPSMTLEELTDWLDEVKEGVAALSGAPVKGVPLPVEVDREAFRAQVKASREAFSALLEAMEATIAKRRAGKPPCAETKARINGATIQHGINWTWANGFPTYEAAAAFDEWCEENGYETRGVYDGNSVRFR